MITEFVVTIEKFGEKGDKTGWTYIRIPAKIAVKIHPEGRKSFRVKGWLDEVQVSALTVLPMGGGEFILPLKAELRKALRKQKGDKLRVRLEEDRTPLKINEELMLCLQDEPAALDFFNSLTPSHQRYFSNWINEAKTNETRTRRVASCVNALAKNWDFGQMIRSGRNTTF